MNVIPSTSQNAEFHHQHGLFKMPLFTKAQCYKPSYWNALTHYFTSLKQLVGFFFSFLTNVVTFRMFKNSDVVLKKKMAEIVQQDLLLNEYLA